MMGMIDGGAPLYLLNAIFALAAPLSRDPSLQPEEGPDGIRPPIWECGTKFAQASSYQLTGQTGTRGDVDIRNFPGQELEVAQTLCCLSFRDATLRRPGTPPSTYLRQALNILMPLGVSQWGIDFEPSAPDTSIRSISPSEEVKARWIHRECHRRTLWVIQWITMLATAVSLTPKKFKDMNLTMCLPVDEGIFEYSITSPLTPGKRVPRGSVP